MGVWGLRPQRGVQGGGAPLAFRRNGCRTKSETQRARS
jgi:hypothetical protein